MGALVRNGYNIDVIEFLLKSFVDMSNSFGEIVIQLNSLNNK